MGKWLDAYERGHVLELWACVGRGAAKSTALYKLALFFTLYGTFRIPPGERHYAIVLSRLVEEAGKGIGIIASWLTLLGVAHRVVGDVLELGDAPRGIRVVAASVSATSGWRAYFVGKDERSKWPTGGVADLDAEEIDTSAAAMTATHPLAPVVSFGSAWGMFGAFYDAITSGSDGSKVALGPTPTWVAAPHISEESTHKKERNPRRWAREFRCEFQAGALGCFEVDHIERAFLPRDGGMDLGQRVVIIDASSGRKDLWTYAVAGWEQPRAPGTMSAIEAYDDQPYVLVGRPARGAPAAAPPPPFLRFSIVDGIEPEKARELGSAGIVARIASIGRQHGAVIAHGDQREAFALQSEFRRAKMRLVVHDWTNTSKVDAVEIVRRWFREGLVSLPVHEAMRRELLSFEEKITASGAFTFGARGNGHDDYVSILLTAAMANLSGGLRTPRSSGTSERRVLPALGLVESQFGPPAPSFFAAPRSGPIYPFGGGPRGGPGPSPHGGGSGGSDF